MPAQNTPKPVINGVQSATVVSPDGKEIDVDEFGRVCVKFLWDRSSETTSCRVRVSQNWAGSGWGGMFFPHPGQEVLVGFMEGDPNRPIVVGRVYNAHNMPPLEPGTGTKSVIRDHGGNELVMEGLDGEQSIHWKQTCGNEILLNGKGGEEGIQLRDKFGSEIVMDAVEGTITLHSPSHDSKIVLGKSLLFGTESDWDVNILGAEFKHVSGKVVWECENDFHKLTMGATSEEFVGWKHTSNAGLFSEVSFALKVDENLLNRVTRSRKHSVDASIFVNIVAGKGDASEIDMDSSRIVIKCGGSKITINKDGDIQVNASGDLICFTEKNMHIASKIMVVSAEKKIDLKHAPVFHKYMKIG